MPNRRTVLRASAVVATGGIAIVAAGHGRSQSEPDEHSNRPGQPMQRPDSIMADTSEDSVDGTDDEPVEPDEAEDQPRDENHDSRSTIGDTLGYYFPSGMRAEDAPIEAFTDVCFHALGIDGDGLPVVTNESALATIAERATAVGTTPHLQVGGMEVDFAPAVSNPRGFASAAVDIMESFGYRGFAIDWEYPDDGAEFALLMEAVRDELDDRGSYHLGAAVSAIPSIADGAYAVERISPITDYLLIMSYDFAGPWSPTTGHNSALFSTAAETNSVESAIEYWRARPIDADQLLAGIPFYARSFSGVTAENQGYNQPFSSGQAYSHGAATSLIDADGYEQYFDDDAYVPYAYSPSEQTFLSYESPESVAAKADFARGVIRGVGVWAINQDPREELVSAL